MVEHVSEGVAVHVLSDEDELLPAVAIRAIPDSVDVGVVFRPLGAGNGGPEVSGAFDATHCASVGPEAGLFEAGGEPKDALGADDTWPFFFEAVVEALGVKGDAAFVDEVGNAVFFGFGSVFDEGIEPAIVSSGAFGIVEACADDEVEGDL